MAGLYKVIWSPKGELFEVAPDLADELVLNKGWFNSKPNLEPETVEEEKEDIPAPVQRGRKAGTKPPSD